MKKEVKNGYILENQFWDFVDDHPDLVKPIHGMLFWWLCHKNNKLRWKEIFGVPTYDTMRMIGVSNYKTYKNAFDDLIDWGFIKLKQKAKNNHTANMITLPKFDSIHKTEVVKNDISNKIEMVTEMVKNTKSCPSHVQVSVAIDKQRKQSVNDFNPKQGAEFLNNVILEFQEAFKEINDMPYIITDEKKEFSAAAKFAERYMQEMKLTDEQEFLTHLAPYFRLVCSVKDNWLHSRMSLPLLVDKFNVVNVSLKSNKGNYVKPLTEDEREFLNM